jgi:hypothetical protein
MATFAPKSRAHLAAAIPAELQDGSRKKTVPGLDRWPGRRGDTAEILGMIAEVRARLYSAAVAYSILHDENFSTAKVYAETSIPVPAFQ